MITGYLRIATPLASSCIRWLLTPYSPELNPQEHIWDELREKHFHNRVFASLDALEDQLVQALKVFEADPQRMHSIAGWDWIINSVSMRNRITARTSTRFVQVFAKLKAMLRKAQAKTVDALWSVIGQLFDQFGSAECERYIRHCGYCGSG